MHRHLRYRLPLLGTLLVIVSSVLVSGQLLQTRVHAASATPIQGCLQAPGSLISWWPAEGNAHDIRGSNNGTLHNRVTYKPGEVGRAFNFSGTNQYVQAGSIGLPTGNHDRTLELWVLIHTVPQVETFFAGYGGFGTNNESYAIGTDSQNRVFFSQWGQAIFGPVLLTDVWYHVAVENIENVAILYLDGQQVAAGLMTIDTAQNTNFLIGRIPGPLGDTRLLNGRVDEVSVYDHALAPATIQAIYKAGSAGKCQ